MKNLNEQILRMKSLMGESRLYGNLVEDKVMINEQSWGKRIIRAIADAIQVEKRALNKINKQIVDNYEKALKAADSGNPNEALKLFKKNQDYINSSKNKDNIQDLLKLQQKRLGDKYDFSAEDVPNFVNMYVTMQKLINVSLAKGWDWNQSVKQFEKSLGLSKEHADAAILIVLHNKPKLRKRLRYALDDSDLLKRKDVITNPDLNKGSKIFNITAENAWELTRKNLDSDWIKLSKKFDDVLEDIDYKQISKEVSDSSENILKRIENALDWKKLGNTIAKVSLWYPLVVGARIFKFLFIYARIPRAAKFFDDLGLGSVSKILGSIPFFSTMYSSYWAWVFYQHNKNIKCDGNGCHSIAAEKEEGRSKEEDFWVENRWKFAGMVAMEWLNNHPYKLFAEFSAPYTGLDIPFRAAKMDLEDLEKVIKQKFINSTMCCPKSELKPVEGVPDDEAIKNKIWNEKFAHEGCEKLNNPGFGCKFPDGKPTCEELYKVLIDPKTSQEMFIELNKKNGMGNGRANYLTRIMEKQFNPFGLSEDEEITPTSGPKGLAFFIQNTISEKTICDYVKTDKLPVKKYQKEIDELLANKMENVDPNDYIEEKIIVINYGPVQDTYDIVTSNIKSGKLDCEDWKNSAYVGNKKTHSEEEKNNIKDALKSYDTFSEYYCEYMTKKAGTTKEGKEVFRMKDCIKAVEGACEGTPFDSLFNEKTIEDEFGG